MNFKLRCFGLAMAAGLALLLASIGIYGVISYTVTQRTRELGVRTALGATRRDLIALVLRQGAALTLVGMALGVGAALGLTRVLRTLLYGVGVTDLATFLLVPLVLTLVGLAASYVPARRAARVDPLVAMRAE